ncbi:YtxH domain-containing protein [Arthrobacter sp. TmT3-37]
MKNKIVFGAGMAAGYVLGTRAGRGSYEQIKTKAQQLWNNPKVQDTVASTTGTIKSKAPAVQDSLKGALKKGGSGSDDGAKKPSEPGVAVGASGDLPLDVPPVVTAMDTGSTGPTGPSGGDPAHVEDTPFLSQDDATRPDLGK